ncbi:hypothetical protein PpBr36_04157 [Pyricularia pennisetigena]|uniref:hypothetical protein n=1 Tax=Pyricularia pennisetigena TaxID=1578925 RepID=UPI00114FFFBB|nr:hypothetical protein PpBr36_04157 [Pyricularia pennisetigena]TLS26323.1 hypothetical protein PpBr36_04157 [Pyricularia pennisetigena]
MKSFTVAAILAAATSLVSAAPATPTGGNPCDVIRCASGTICQVSADGTTGRCVPEAEQQCGEDVVCGHGSRCCNPIRGICVSPPNMFCIMSGPVFNDDDDDDDESTTTTTTTTPAEPTAPAPAGPCDDVVCTGTTICRPSEDASSAECVPIAEQQCGPDVVCAHGQRCCNQFLGICITPPDMACPRIAAAPVQQLEQKMEEEEQQQQQQQQQQSNGTVCGSNICQADETCCNASCGYCTKPGQGCTKEFCLPESGPRCGRETVCPVGWECCNESCGTCVLPGNSCTMQFCGN